MDSSHKLTIYLRFTALVIAGLWSKYHPFCFASRHLIFLLFLFLSERLVKRISQTAGDSRTISTDPQTGVRETTQVSFSLTFWFIFQLFQVDWKTQSKFTRKLFNQYENSLWSLIKVFEIYKNNTYGMNGDCRTTYSTFSRWKMSQLEKQKKQLNIHDTIQPIFIKFSPKW